MSFRARVTREDDEDDENEDARARRRATRTSTRRFVVRMNADIVELTSVIVREASDTGAVSDGCVDLVVVVVVILGRRGRRRGVA